ncbi:MAG TPA: cytidine deaminase [Bacteroidales bacterium]|nr:cytidine deaminase [Bacteroidales bacterium]
MRMVDGSRFQEFNSPDELGQDDRILLEQAIESTKDAYAPYSQYYVGAAVRLSNGSMVKGNNQENVAYPSGLCAERVALFAASALYPGVPVMAIAIAGHAKNFLITDPVTPCGACRQVIAEYEKLYDQPVRLVMMGEKSKIWIAESISHLLPLMFHADELRKKH